MRSLTLAAVLLFAVALVAVRAEVKTQKWILLNLTTPYSTNTSFGSCRVYMLSDGWIGLHSTVRLDGSVKVFHNIMLMPIYADMVVSFNQGWTPVYDNGKPQANSTPFVQEDFFWKTCGGILPLMPAKYLSEFHGWHGLPNPTPTK